MEITSCYFHRLVPLCFPRCGNISSAEVCKQVRDCVGFVPKTSMEVKDELMDIVEKVWHKLQSLPDATPLELGAFSVIILFFGKKGNRHLLLAPTVGVQTVCTIHIFYFLKLIHFQTYFRLRLWLCCGFVCHDKVKLKDITNPYKTSDKLMMN